MPNIYLQNLLNSNVNGTPVDIFSTSLSNLVILCFSHPKMQQKSDLFDEGNQVFGQRGFITIKQTSWASLCMK